MGYGSISFHYTNTRDRESDVVTLPNGEERRLVLTASGGHTGDYAHLYGATSTAGPWFLLASVAAGNAIQVPAMPPRYLKATRAGNNGGVPGTLVVGAYWALPDIRGPEGAEGPQGPPGDFWAVQTVSPRDWMADEGSDVVASLTLAEWEGSTHGYTFYGVHRTGAGVCTPLRVDFAAYWTGAGWNVGITDPLGDFTVSLDGDTLSLSFTAGRLGNGNMRGTVFGTFYS